MSENKELLNNRSICSWNVNGLRATVRNFPDILSSIVSYYNLDILCLQETKLQTTHEDDFRNHIPGYTSFWCSSVLRKGYSGTAIFVRNDIMYGYYNTHDHGHQLPEINDQNLEKTKINFFLRQIDLDTLKFAPYEAKAEGRMIVLEFRYYVLINLYVPNSGSEKLKYRVEDWDVKLYNCLCEIRTMTNKPIMMTGDLNICITELDIHPAMGLIPGATPEERYSFSRFLPYFVDIYRMMYPNETNCYTWRNLRAKNSSKGCRLDYFMLNHELVPYVINTFINSQIEGSDHVPIFLNIKI